MTTTNGTKYTFTCDPDECDTLIEVTCVSGFGFHNGVIKHTCPCGREMSYISATILSSEQPTKEENKMEATTEYLQNQIKILQNNLAAHQNCDYWKAENGRVQSQLIDLINAGHEDDLDASELLITMAEIIDYHPTKEIFFSGTISFGGRIDVSVHDLEDFNLEEVLADVDVDVNNGDVVIDHCGLETVEEN